MRRGFLTLLTLGLLLSCTSLSKPQGGGQEKQGGEPGYAELKLAELKTLGASEPSRAIEAALALLYPLKPETKIEASREDLEAIVRDSAEVLAKNYASSKTLGDWKAALVASRSLRVLAGDDRLAGLVPAQAREVLGDPGASEESLILSRAEAYYARHLLAPALALHESLVLARKGGLGASPDEEVLLWAQRALEGRNRLLLGRYAAELVRRGLPLPKGAKEFAAPSPSIQDMRHGVVTIRIDKGIKIEGGLGVPDRVLGTGFYIDPAGYVLTNYHVIQSEVDPTYEGYSRLSIRPSESPDDRIAAKVVGWDRLLDLALLKVEAKPEFVFALDDAEDRLSQGERIYAIGSPVGLENTVTSGIVSALGRRLLPTGEVMQVDAPLNPGNSGGPLLDEGGRTVGIVFAGAPAYQGLSFAIPSAWALRVLPALFDGGEVTRAWLGLGVAGLGGRGQGGRASDLEVTYTFPGLARSVSRRDVLSTLNLAKLGGIASAQAILLGHLPGELVSLGLANSPQARIMALAERAYAPLETTASLDRKDRLFPMLFGMEIRSLPATLLDPESFSVSRVIPGSVADEGGLSENDPFSLHRYVVDRKSRVIYIQIQVKQRKAGYLEVLRQLPAALDSPDLL